MKIIVHLCLFIFLFISITCPAQQSEKEIKINKYISTLKKYQKNKPYRNFNKLTDLEFKIILKEIYEAIEISPNEVNDIFVEDNNRWKHEIKMDKKNDKIKSKYGLVYYFTLEEVKKRYSEVVYLLIRIPVFIKGTIISIREDYNDDGFGRYVIKMKPEQVIKGTLPVIHEQEFDIYYRNYDRVFPQKDFKVGNSYLFPLWDRNEPNHPELAVATWIDEHGSRFLIKDGFLFDEHNISALLLIEWVINKEKQLCCLQRSFADITVVR
jgi:hypothetical protein